MSDHYSSEQELFETPDNSPERPDKPKRNKRSSWETRFPVRPRLSADLTAEMAPGNDKGKGVEGSGSGGDGSKSPPPAPAPPQKGGSGYQGTAIGLPGFVPVERGSLTFKGTGEDGQTVQFNVFETVFTGGKFGSDQLETLLNYMEANNKLDFSSFIENITYQGFDRLFYISAALKVVSVSVFCRFAILGAIRGSKFDKIKGSCISMPEDLSKLITEGKVIKKAVKRSDLTILRFTASIPHWVAFWLYKVDIPKKIESQDCPGWLQFPGAASLPMGKKQRMQHIAFCKAFSNLIPGGSFNGNIYLTAYMNPIPLKDIPTAIKDQLGVGATDKTSGVITQAEIQKEVIGDRALIKT